jgi:hypothetical protein
MLFERWVPLGHPLWRLALLTLFLIEASTDAYFAVFSMVIVRGSPPRGAGDRRTRKALGFPINLHRFRRAAATLWSVQAYSLKCQAAVP